MNPSHKLILALLIAGAAPTALAQNRAEDCIAITTDQDRLACYDRLHGRSGPAAADAGGSRAATAVLNADTTTPAPTRLASRWDLQGVRGEMYAPRAYRAVYLLPATWTSHSNQRPYSPAPRHQVDSDLQVQDHEAKYQLSLKSKLAQDILGTPLSLWGAYTQSSRWQVYNSAISRPFRETDYEPELMLVAPLQGRVLGWDLRYGSLALLHQSNGRSLPLSRSWNRVVATIGMDRGDWVMELRPWVRIGEKPGDDDNPDVLDYFGRAEVRISRNWNDNTVALQLRHSLRGGAKSRGSAELEWAFPIRGTLHGYVQAFSGYGESLIDYNQHQTKFGFGVTIAGWR